MVRCSVVLMCHWRVDTEIVENFSNATSFRRGRMLSDLPQQNQRCSFPLSHNFIHLLKRQHNNTQKNENLTNQQHKTLKRYLAQSAQWRHIMFSEAETFCRNLHFLLLTETDGNGQVEHLHAIGGDLLWISFENFHRARFNSKNNSTKWKQQPRQLATPAKHVNTLKFTPTKFKYTLKFRKAVWMQQWTRFYKSVCVSIIMYADVAICYSFTRIVTCLRKSTSKLTPFHQS